MRRLLPLVLTAFFGSLVAASCLTTSSYACDADSQCVNGGVQGSCEAVGFCSFPDGACASGKRFGEYAGESLGGACVEGDSATGSQSESTTLLTTTASTTEPTSTTSTTGPCVDLGGTCSIDTECCGPCTRCDQGACVADVGAQSTCAPCFTCDAQAACAPAAAGGACTVACDTIVVGAEINGDTLNCLRGQPGEAAGVCDADGVCAPAVDACVGGEVLYSCSATCAKKSVGCELGTPVDQVKLGDLCELGKSTPECKTSCTDAVLTDQACDDAGYCVVSQTTECAPYGCEKAGGPCRTSCMGKSDCADGFNCMAQMCQ